MPVAAAADGTPRTDIRIPMLDLLMIAIGLGFFAVGCLYLSACDRL